MDQQEKDRLTDVRLLEQEVDALVRDAAGAIADGGYSRSFAVCTPDSRCLVKVAPEGRARQWCVSMTVATCLGGGYLKLKVCVLKTGTKRAVMGFFKDREAKKMILESVFRLLDPG